MSRDVDRGKPTERPPSQPNTVGRREALVAGATVLVGAAAAANLGTTSASPFDSNARPADDESPRASGSRAPVVYLPHGGGPWPFVEMGFDKRELTDLTAYIKSLPALPKAPVSAILLISAHWEEPVPTVMTAARPPMLYDYYGFPPESYQITWPAPGHPTLAARVRTLLGGAGFTTAADPARGFDHGAFVPLKLAYPAADVPTLQLSLVRGLDPEQHVAIGRALTPLRDEGVYIIASGMSFHNMRTFQTARGADAAEAFDAWLRETVSLEPVERDRRLTRWSEAPAAREAHPREEHLIPLMVAAGAAADDRGVTAFNGPVLGVRVSAHHFG